jgi:L-ascorbate metabolism protein UlaG (beta-lactamase superfamily)
MSVRIEWIAHACFRLTSDDGLVVVTDPYEPNELGLPRLTLAADVVVASSLEDRGHWNPEAVPHARIVDALSVARSGQDEIAGERVVAVEVREAEHHPQGPDANAMYGFRLGGLAFVHMGDLGHPAAPQHLAPFRDRCDVLFALTGGGLTIGLEDLDAVIEALEPRWIVPMHYAHPGLDARVRSGMLPFEAFLERRRRDRVVDAAAAAITLPLEDASSRPTIVVLRPRALEDHSVHPVMPS